MISCLFMEIHQRVVQQKSTILLDGLNYSIDSSFKILATFRQVNQPKFIYWKRTIRLYKYDEKFVVKALLWFLQIEDQDEIN